MVHVKVLPGTQYSPNYKQFERFAQLSCIWAPHTLDLYYIPQAHQQLKPNEFQCCADWNHISRDANLLRCKIWRFFLNNTLVSNYPTCPAPPCKEKGDETSSPSNRPPCICPQIDLDQLAMFILTLEREKRKKKKSGSNWNLERVVFEERRKPEYLEKKLSEQRREPTINSTHIWDRVHKSIPSHIAVITLFHLLAQVLVKD